ncbi:hypothetical protein [Streptomyces griseoaurantiacus]
MNSTRSGSPPTASWPGDFEVAEAGLQDALEQLGQRIANPL